MRAETSHQLHRCFTQAREAAGSRILEEHALRSSLQPARTGTLSRFQRRVREMRRVKVTRHVTQLVVGGIIVVAAVRHQVEKATGAASVDALCPFGALETLLTWATTGNFVTKIHPSNLVLGIGLLVGTLLVGNAFCG
jgi:hypothetical protein